MPVYNGANYLAETLDCWLRQDYAEFRMLVSDNASIDATPDIRRQLDRLRDLKPGAGRVNRAPVDGVFLTHAVGRSLEREAPRVQL